MLFTHLPSLGSDSCTFALAGGKRLGHFSTRCFALHSQFRRGGAGPFPIGDAPRHFLGTQPRAVDSMVSCRLHSNGRAWLPFSLPALDRIRTAKGVIDGNDH